MKKQALSSLDDHEKIKYSINWKNKPFRPEAFRKVGKQRKEQITLLEAKELVSQGIITDAKFKKYLTEKEGKMHKIATPKNKNKLYNHLAAAMGIQGII